MCRGLFLHIVGANSVPTFNCLISDQRAIITTTTGNTRIDLSSRIGHY